MFETRKEELSLLDAQVELLRNGSRLTVLTRRTGLGKTTLLQQFTRAASIPALYINLEIGLTESEAVERFKKVIRNFFPSTEKVPEFTKLSDGIRCVLQFSKEKPLILIFDELQLQETTEKRYWSELQNIWDRLKDESRLLLIFSSSRISTTRKFFLDYNEPMYGRTNLLLELRPLSIQKIISYFQSKYPTSSKEDLLLFYAFTGGVLYLMEELTSSNGFPSDDLQSFLTFSKSSRYRELGIRILKDELGDETQLCLPVLRAISNGVTGKAELEEKFSSSVEEILFNLEHRFCLVRQITSFGKERSAEDCRYQLTEEWLRFGFAFIEPSSFISSRDRNKLELQESFEIRQKPQLKTFKASIRQLSLEKIDS